MTRTTFADILASRVEALRELAARLAEGDTIPADLGDWAEHDPLGSRLLRLHEAWEDADHARFLNIVEEGDEPEWVEVVEQYRSLLPYQCAACGDEGVIVSDVEPHEPGGITVSPCRFCGE